jgi:hypothetical protein
MHHGMGGERKQEHGYEDGEAAAEREHAHGLDEAWRSVGNMAVFFLAASGDVASLEPVV